MALEILMGRGPGPPEMPLPSHSALPLSLGAGYGNPPQELVVRSLSLSDVETGVVLESPLLLLVVSFAEI